MSIPTATAPPGPPPNSPTEQGSPARPERGRHWLAGLVGGRVSSLQEAYLNESARGHSSAQATLARLRHGVGKEDQIGAIPEIVDITIGGIVPPDVRASDEPTRDELAAYTAVTLYALHQQSQAGRMHVQYRSLGQAMGELRVRAGIGEGDAGILRTFNALMTAADVKEASYHARRAIALLRSAGIPLDYGRLAEDLRDLQLPKRAASVRLRWGRDFYRHRSQAAAEGDVSSTTSTEGATS